MSPRSRIRAAAPQLLTMARAVMAAMAIGEVHRGSFYRAAALITLGAVTDGLDGFVARRLGVASSFGALFDYFADYLCYIVAPWELSGAIVADSSGPLSRALIGLPLLTGALRYARNGVLAVEPGTGGRDLPGLATVFFAFASVTAVFIDARALVPEPLLSRTIIGMVTVFSLLQIAPIRYPKLGRFAGAAPAALVLLAIMPFAGTRVLAFATLVLGVLYAAFAPLAARIGVESPAEPSRRSRVRRAGPSST